MVDLILLSMLKNKGGGNSLFIPGTGVNSIMAITASEASGSYSYAEGGGTTASGANSHAEGGGTTASGNSAHSEGTGTIASGNYSHAECSGTKAYGANSHAEGSYTTAAGTASHAEGYKTKASAQQAHAEGLNTTASGVNSHAAGNHTIAKHADQYVFGSFNIQDPSSASSAQHGTYVEIIGNGTADDARSNARTLDWSGNERLAGDLTVNVNNTEHTISSLISRIAALEANSGGSGNGGKEPIELTVEQFNRTQHVPSLIDEETYNNMEDSPFYIITNMKADQIIQLIEENNIFYLVFPSNDSFKYLITQTYFNPSGQVSLRFSTFSQTRPSLEFNNLNTGREGCLYCINSFN